MLYIELPYLKHWLLQINSFRNYSRGQPKPSKLLSQQGVHLGLRFLHILAQIVKMNQKNIPPKTFPRCFRTANILGQKIATLLRGKSQVWVVTVLLHIIKRLRTIENGIQMLHHQETLTLLWLSLGVFDCLCSWLGALLESKIL